MFVSLNLQRKEEDEEEEEELGENDEKIEYHKEIDDKDKMEGNRNDMRHSHYDTSSNDGVESSIH